nr:pentapeptide repeat-containing protein [Herbihabitans rhizosphaerae]
MLLTDPKTSKVEALKTGGIAAGAIVALYALWLNDRRRRVEEQRQRVERDRHELESARTEHDRERVSDERFARAVELLGHETSQVRVGALLALVGLARSRPEYTQTVLDVLCSCLRQPFKHTRYNLVESGQRPKWALDGDENDHELQVRLTALRLITDLLPSGEDAPAYDLDLTGAVLEYVNFSGKTIGTLTLRWAKLYRSTSLSGCRVLGSAWFTGAKVWGWFNAAGLDCHARVWFSGFEANWQVDLTGATFRGDHKFSGATFHDALKLGGATFAVPPDLSEVSVRGDLDLTATGLDADKAAGMTVALGRETRLPSHCVVERRDGGVGVVVPQR